MKYTIGIDFGTLSARAVLVDTQNGNTVAEHTVLYPHGVMDTSLPDGTPLPTGFALQCPSDYLYALKQTIAGVLASSPVSADDVAAIGIDFTSCTVVTHYADGTPLCDDPRFKSKPHAYVKLWKHHGAQTEADDLLRVAIKRDEKWLNYCGRQISSEWMFPKILETYRKSRDVYNAAYRFSEAGDWLSLMLTGTETHVSSFAGFKSFWNADDGYPSSEYFAAVEEGIADVVGTKISPDTVNVPNSVGTLNSRGADLTGLNVGTVVAPPQLDAHMSLPALGITAPGTLMMIVGTSGCYILHSKTPIAIDGICGSCMSAVIPDLCTYEAGIVSCGDHLDWFVKNCVPENYVKSARESGISIHQYLRDKAQRLAIGQSGLVALNWFNGNRCPLSDSGLSGTVVGLTLTSKPEEIYRALVEAVVFQTTIILQSYIDAGIEINDIIASGGIASKDPMLMQMLADVTARPIRVANTSQTSAIGAAIYAATACGIYPTVSDAAAVMSIGADKIYTPIAENTKAYLPLLDIYKQLHSYFGCESDIMHKLTSLKKL